MGEGHPPDGEAWRDRLARGPEVSDVLWGQPLKRTDRVAVVAELRVVVVLDDQRLVLLRPRDQCPATLGRQDGSDGY
jgi:hypothetical protein